MARHEVHLPRWLPVSLNKLKGNKYGSAKLKKADRDYLAAAPEMGAVPRVAVPRSVVRESRAYGVAVPPLSNWPPWREPCPRRIELSLVYPWPWAPRGGLLPGVPRMRDSDNSWKSLLDSLVEGGWLVDDRDRWCDIPRKPEQRVAAAGEPWGTTLIITDLE